MDTRLPLGVSLAAQLVLFSLVLVSAGLAHMVYFGLFWVATLVTLFLLLEQRRWESRSWFAFAALSAGLIIAVLFSLHAIQDRAGIGIPLVGLFFVAAALQAIPGRRRVERSRSFPVLAARGGKKYHRPDCRLVRNKDGLMMFRSPAAARMAGKEPCAVCLEE